MAPLFITGIGTGIGKTIISAIVTEALEADYWKPVQAGFEEGTDALQVQSLISNPHTVIHPEVYRLTMPASPHIAAREEGIQIDLDYIASQLPLQTERPLVIEGAGGLLVPLNETASVADLVLRLQARVILVSRNYLGSINHSLLTAEVCKQRGITVAGWIFNDQYLQYENEIAQWSGFPVLASIPFSHTLDKTFIQEQAKAIRLPLQGLL